MSINKSIDILQMLNKHPRWPTHRHPPEFWEALGRSVATFGFLEEMIAKAIFAISGSKKIAELDDVEKEVQAWIKELQITLSYTLGILTKKYEKALEFNSTFKTEKTDLLIKDLKALIEWRNIFCHCSWGVPNENGKSFPLYMNSDGKVLETQVDIKLIEQVMRKTVELTCEVIESVTTQGYTFPGKAPGAIQSS